MARLTTSDANEGLSPIHSSQGAWSAFSLIRPCLKERTGDSKVSGLAARCTWRCGRLQRVTSAVTSPLIGEEVRQKMRGQVLRT